MFSADWRPLVGGQVLVGLVVGRAVEAVAGAVP